MTILKKYYPFILLILFIALGFFVISRPPSDSQNNSANQHALPQEENVVLTKEGFNPQSITIKQGSAVRWKNSTTDKASVNSDNYPTNKLYPELNLGIFKPGTTLVHIFTKKGKFSYHDELHPKNTGEVTVQ